MLFTKLKDTGFSATQGLIIILVIAIIAGIISLKYEQKQANNNNSVRMSDIRALQISLEKYYVITNHYPSLNEINNDSWRHNNLTGLSNQDMTDPGWTSSNKYCVFRDQPLLISQLKPDCYQYQPTTNNDHSCNNQPSACLKYTLGAKLQDGQGVYIRKNLA